MSRPGKPRSARPEPVAARAAAEPVTTGTSDANAGETISPPVSAADGIAVNPPAAKPPAPDLKTAGPAGKSPSFNAAPTANGRPAPANAKGTPPANGRSVAPPATPPGGDGGSRWVAPLAGGLVGAAIALSAAYLLSGPLFGDRPGRTDPALLGRLATLENRVAGVDTLQAQMTSLRDRAPRLEADLGELGTRLDVLGSEVAKLEARPSPNGATDELAVRLDGMATELAGLRQVLEQAAQSAAAMAPRLEAAEGRLAGLAPISEIVAPLPGRLDAADAALGELRTTIASNGAAARTAALQVSELRTAVAADREAARAADAAMGELRQALASEREATAAMGTALGQLRDAAGRDREAAGAADAALRAALEAAIASSGRTVAAEAGTAIERVGTELTQLERSVGQLQQMTGEALARLDQNLTRLQLVGERAASLALATSDARRALADGAPVQEPLDRLERLAAGDPSLAPAVEALAAAGGAGFVSPVELRRQLDAIPPGASATGGTSAGWLGNVGQLVEVEASDPSEQRAREAVGVARERLAAGDWVGAREALGPVAGEGNTAAAAWMEAVDRRLAAERAIEQLESRLQALLAAAG